MAQDIKAGIPFVLKVNTKADKMGFESGFQLHYFDDANQTVVHPAVTFFEFSDSAVDGTNATTASANVVVGATNIPLTSTTGYTAGSTVLIGGVYYRVSSVDATSITLKRGLDGAVTAADPVVVSGRTGTYGAELTFQAAGKYTVHITNFAIGMDNEPAPIHVAAATVDDVKLLIDSLQSDMSSVKTQVDILDEASLNGLSTQVTNVADNLDAVHTLLKDTSDVYFELNGDESAIAVVGATLTGVTSAATGVVQYSVYDAVAAVTKITVQSATGTFVAGETVTDGTTATTGIISGLQNNVVNSVIEFVSEIKGLLGSASGLDALSGLNKDIEHMLKGDALLEDGTANPTAGKALTQIFDELVVNHADLTTLKTLAEDATNGFAAIKTSVVDARASIEAKLAGLIDEADANSLASKANAIKTVVDANSTLLNDGTNGLANIKTQIDAVLAMFQNGGTAELRFTAIDTSIINLSTSLDAQTTHLDTRFDEVVAQLNAADNSTKYTVFA